MPDTHELKRLRCYRGGMSSDLAGDVAEVLAVDADEFSSQAEEDAEVVKAALREGTFDNHQSIIGLEYEFYAVAQGRWTAGEDDGENGQLRRVPRRLLEYVGFEKELGLHNAEMCTNPQPLNPHGIRAQVAEVRARLSAAQDVMNAEGMRLVSDAMWTVPPTGESARQYLCDSVESDGVRLATNMSNAVRYHAMANGPNSPDTMGLDAPNVTLDAETVMPESLITSIQPHYQVPHAADLPDYFNYAVRVAGPLLALGVNSPFFPPDLYDEGVSPERILAEARDEHRIGVFESVLNRTNAEKVRFPQDLKTVEQAVDRIAQDAATVPMPVTDSGERFDSRFATFRLKHGTYWRWVRPVFDGATEAGANARIEFRPIPGQPTVTDSVAFQAAFAGLMESLPRREHPVAGLDWETARDNFYGAAENGLAAEQRWITNDGQETTDSAELYDDLLAHAKDGLESRGCTTEEAAAYVAPLTARVESGRTPAQWKREEVERRLDRGDDFETAVYGMQRRYIEHQTESLIDGSFVDWAV
jgi:hypothetical protein